MGARSAPELAQWRTAPYSVSYMAYIHAPTTVAACRLNMASGSYPGTSITVDGYTTGAYTDILEGLTVLIGSSAGADDYGRTRVRAASDGTVSTSTTINVGRYSQGTRDGELTIVDNAYVTVLSLRTIWATPPFISTDELTYKDGAIAFDATKAQPPIASADSGDIFEIVATSGDSATVSIPCTATATHPDATSTLDYTLTIADATPSSRSGTATSGNQFTPSSFSIPVGVRYGSLQVTDSLGNVTMQYFLVVVQYEGSPDLFTGFEITRWTERADGQEMQIRVSDPLPYSTYPDGAEILIRQRERYGTTVSSVVDDDEIVFAGFIGSESNEGSASRKGFIARTTLTLVDAAGRLKQLPGFPMVVERKASPTQWEHLEGANVDRYIWHLVKWHSTIASRVPFTWSGTGESYPFSTLGSDGQSLWEQASVRTQAIGYALTCDHRGRIAMRGDPQILPTSAQAAAYSLPTSRVTTLTLTVTTGDWKSYRYTYTRHPRIHWNWGEAILTSTTDADAAEIGTVFCVAPGSAPGQGVTAQTSGQQLAVSQYELNVREGHRYAARMNSRYGYVEASVRGGSVGVHPANMEWVQFDIDASTAAPRGRTFSNQKFLPVEVSYTVNHKNGTREARLSLEVEAQGSIAESYYPPEGDGTTVFPPYIPPYTPPTTYTPVYDGSGIAPNLSNLGMWNADGYLYRTNTAKSASPVWSRTNLSLTGTVAAACVNPFWQVYTPATGDDLTAWVATTSGVYTQEGADFDAAPTMTERHSFTYAPTSVTIESSISARNWVIAVYYRENATNGGTYAAYSMDGAAFTEVQITSAYAASGTSDRPQLYMSIHTAGVAWVIAFKTSTTTAIYKTTNYGASWAEDTTLGMVSSTAICPLHFPWHDNSAENRLYFGYVGTNDARLYRAAAGSAANISPTLGGGNVGLRSFRGISTANNDRQSLITRLVGAGTYGGNSALYTSRDGGTTLTQITSGTATSYLSVHAPTRDSFYAWGDSGAIGYAGDFATIRSLMGNISSFTPGENLNIYGG